MKSSNVSNLLSKAKKNSVEQYTDQELEQKAVELYYVDQPDVDLISDILMEGYNRNNELIKSLVADAVYKGDHGMKENKDLAWTLANEAFAMRQPMGAYVLAQIYIDRTKFQGNADLFLAELLLSIVKDQLPWANDLLAGMQLLKEQGEDMSPIDFMEMNNHHLVDAMNYYTALTWKNDSQGYRGVADILSKWPCFQRDMSAIDFYEKGALCPNPDPKCQYMLAHKYTGMKRHKEAFELYMKAYNGGYKKASVQIAHSLWFGIGTGKKRKEAQKFFIEAMKGAYISADYAYKYFFGNASKLYREAEHLHKEEKNIEAAVEKYIKAYDAGNPVAAYKIAKIFCFTMEYKEDSHIPEAKQWMEAFLASDGFDDAKVIKKLDERTPFEYGAYYTLAHCYSLEYYLAITKQIDDYSSDCFQKAFEWCKKAAELNNAEGQYFMGDYYERGIGVEKDMLTAYMCYSVGKGTVKSLTKAFNWFLKAANNGDPNGACMVGISYLTGQGVAINRIEAIRWLKTAAQQGDEIAQKELRNMHISW